MSKLIRVTNRRATVDEASRAVDFVLSTEIEDRAGDTIALDGWKLDAYRKNPVVLWSHNHSIPAIGRCEKIRVDGKALVGQVVFASAEQHPFADTIYRLVAGRFINTGSVGFIPLEWKFTDKGIAFVEHELIEYTICNVPMNPQALARAASEGVDIEPLVKAVNPEVKSYEQMRAALVDEKGGGDDAPAVSLERFRNRSKALTTKLRVRSNL